jgi:cysteine desulfurase
MSKPVYLDYAAATPMANEAIEVMQPFLQERFYNPSAVYQQAREVRKVVETARAQVANVLGAKQQEIIFTAGGTESNNLAISGVMSQFEDGEMLVSSIEHESVLEPAGKFNTKQIPVDKNGIIQINKIAELITDGTVLISVMYANNEIGAVQPIKELAAIVKVIRADRVKKGVKTPLYLHTDACQAANYLDLQVARLGVDLMTLNGGKIYGPKQSGCLYVKAGIQLNPLVYGGGQEGGLRSGTENVAALLSFATMLQKVQGIRKDEAQRLLKLKNMLFATLSQKISDIQLNGHKLKRLPNNLNITIDKVDGERLLMELDEAGVMVATGSACTASNDEPSHVLLACGLSPEEASASIRITLGQNTTEVEIQNAGQVISEVVNKHDRLV